MLRSIFISGLGGQGIVTLAGLIAEQAAVAGLKVSLFNAKGMAQRGGRVSSEIRMSDVPKLEFGARISAGKADILIGMEIGEAIDSFSLLKEGGTAILLDHTLVPAPMVLNKQPYPSFDQLTGLYARKAGRIFPVTGAKHPHNIFLLGVFAAVAPSITQELSFYTRQVVEEAIRRMDRGPEENLQSFNGGYGCGRSLLQL